MRICSLASGSSGNATYIASERTSILVDCGTSAREVEARLASIEVDPAEIDAILITHAHTDHYRCAGTLNARYGIPVHVDPSTARAIRSRDRWTSWKRLRETMPIPDHVGDIEVRALDTSHGFPARDGRTVAYLFKNRGRRVGVVTDLGKPTRGLVAALKGVDAIVLEANYDEEVLRDKLSDPGFAGDWRYLEWVASEMGHLSNSQCAQILSEILDDGSAHVFIGHVSENHHDPRQDNNESEHAMRVIRGLLARDGLPAPHLHRTYRIGRDASKASRVIVV
ncbi:MAG: MBL fold metallo-hydrolase [Candidatus Eisenbacteria bacterium]|nr:MBL fold metallo-hydrolase [Candidatus Eisenbacteria bacterium]